MQQHEQQTWDVLVRAIIRRGLDGESSKTISSDLRVGARHCDLILRAVEGYPSKYRSTCGTKHLALFGLEALCATTCYDSPHRAAISSYLWRLSMHNPIQLQQTIATGLSLTNTDGRIVITPASVNNPPLISRIKQYLAATKRVTDAGLTIQLYEYWSVGQTRTKTAQLRALALGMRSKPVPLRPKNNNATYLEHLLVAIHRPGETHTVLSHEWLHLLALADIASLAQTWREFVHPHQKGFRRHVSSLLQGQLFALP